MIPYSALDISLSLQQKLKGSNAKLRKALTVGTLCENDQERLGMLVLLAGDEEQDVAQAAQKHLKRWEAKRLIASLHRQTHAKVVEYIADFIAPVDELDQEIIRCVNINRRTVKLVARRCGLAACEDISKSQQLLLLYNDLLLDLESNENCEASSIQRAASFLRMQNALPNGYLEQEEQGSTRSLDFRAEINAALAGELSPFFLGQQKEGHPLEFRVEDLGGFIFDFADRALEELSFSIGASGLNDDADEEDNKGKSLEAQIKNLKIGEKIKLAYRGNKSARGILIRDTNKSVATAVIKSGRVSVGEAANYAGNANLCDDVIREIARNKEFLRKYTVQVALVNNPKTPVGVAIRLISSLHKRDLQSLARNRGVPSTVSLAAKKLFIKKYRGGG
ncbi:MAG: hypothetical protein CMK59_12720 [Proteobacteria bacterium]|nr:hypothetical protein [Pseudomonadota bacterium]